MNLETSVADDVTAQEQNENWLHYHICIYKCKNKKTMAKHMTDKHKDLRKCDICGEMFGDSDLMEEQKMIDHSSKEKVNLDDPNYKNRVEDENL